MTQPDSTTATQPAAALILARPSMQLEHSTSQFYGGGPFGARGGLAMNLNPMPLMNLNFDGGGELVDEKWRKQQILELEVYSKRLELVQDQIKAAMEELQSNGA